METFGLRPVFDGDWNKPEHGELVDRLQVSAERAGPVDALVRLHALLAREPP